LCAAHSRLRLHAFIADKNPKGANDGEKCNAFLRPCWSWPAAATHGSLSGGAVTGMLGDGLLLRHLDRADYPGRYADADMGSVAYIDLAPHSYATVSGDWQFDYRRSSNVPDGRGNLSFYLCLSPASGSPARAGGVDEADVGQFPCQKTYRGRKKSH